jgi:hypothetical protein
VYEINLHLCPIALLFFKELVAEFSRGKKGREGGKQTKNSANRAFLVKVTENI